MSLQTRSDAPPCKPHSVACGDCKQTQAASVELRTPSRCSTYLWRVQIGPTCRFKETHRCWNLQVLNLWLMWADYMWFLSTVSISHVGKYFLMKFFFCSWLHLSSVTHLVHFMHAMRLALPKTLHVIVKLGIHASGTNKTSTVLFKELFCFRKADLESSNVKKKSRSPRPHTDICWHPGSQRLGPSACKNVQHQ